MTLRDDFLAEMRLMLLAQSAFRQRTAERYPTDKRNLIAADALEALAFDAVLAQDTWEALQQLATPGNNFHRFFRSPDFLQACRDVGFRSAPASLDKFVAGVLARLAEPVGAR
jgi:hypothetical protein